MTTPAPIAAVQALVGCPHTDLLPFNHVGGSGQTSTSYYCAGCRDSDGRAIPLIRLPAPAPDCSTTQGAMAAALDLEVSIIVNLLPFEEKEGYVIESHGEVVHRHMIVTKRNLDSVPADICTQILSALDNNQGKQ